MDLRVFRGRLGALVFPLAILFAGCDLSLGHLAARATDEWTRTYPLSPGGEVRIVNTNGKVEIEGVDGSTVEVRAERIARGATDAAARECIQETMYALEIDPPAGGGVVTVRYPFEFHP